MEPRQNPLRSRLRPLAAAIRSLSGQPQLKVVSGHRHSVSPEGVSLVLPEGEFSEGKLRCLRGQADSAAARLRFHRPSSFVAATGADSVVQELLEELEQARVEAQAARRWPGVADNLYALLERDWRKRGFGTRYAIETIPMSELLGLLVRLRLFQRPPPASASTVVDHWRLRIEQQTGGRIGQLSALIDDQDAFAAKVLEIATALKLIRADARDPEQGTDASLDTRETINRNRSRDEPGEQGEAHRENAQTSDQGGADGDLDTGRQGEDAVSLGISPALSDRQLLTRSASEQNSKTSGRREPGGYRVFTRRFDQVVTPAEVCDLQTLSQLRIRLDRSLKPWQTTISRYANRLKNQLLTRQARSWQHGLEEGVLDGSRLTELVIDPQYPLAWKGEQESDFPDTVVSLLIDNSGSMRGTPIRIAALCADILARTLERCRVKVEVLGFTTRAWDGGRARQAWLEQGRPPLPGRLTELRHVIYKQADEPWRHARNNLGYMLQGDQLRENVDGEALLWAHNRLSGRPEQRKILVVISDGAPVDDCTLTMNTPDLLERHLRWVIDGIESSARVELMAIGIGHDVSRYYRHATTLSNAEQLGITLFDELSVLLGCTRLK